MLLLGTVVFVSLLPIWTVFGGGDYGEEISVMISVCFHKSRRC